MWAIALPDGTTRDAIDDAMRSAGLVLVDLRAAGPGQPRQVVAMTPDRRGAVTFALDPALAYALADGERAEALCRALGAALGVRAWGAIDPALRAHIEATASLFEPQGGS